MDRKLKQLARGLRQKTWHTREASARALGQLGSVAEPAVPALCKALEDKVPQVRRTAVWALAHIGSREAIPFLLDAKWDPDWWVSAGAHQALDELFSPAQADWGWPVNDALGG